MSLCTSSKEQNLLVKWWLSILVIYSLVVICHVHCSKMKPFVALVMISNGWLGIFLFCKLHLSLLFQILDFHGSGVLVVLSQVENGLFIWKIKTIIIRDTCAPAPQTITLAEHRPTCCCCTHAWLCKEWSKFISYSKVKVGLLWY